MTPARYLSPLEAAHRLGVSAKALRLYEQRGFVSPLRTEAGWRAYGPEAMARLGEVVALRSLGFSLAHIGRLLAGDDRGLEQALALHQGNLEAQLQRLSGAVAKVRSIRTDLAQGKAAAIGDLVRLVEPAGTPAVEFELPWPWGGERFALRSLLPITYIIGPLGSGKTRLAQRLAEALPGASFLGLDRLEHDAMAARSALETDTALKTRVEQALAWLVDEGAEPSHALLALLAGIENEAASVVVVDMVEQNLSQPTQEALSAYLRRRGREGKPLFLMTRSSAILDLSAVGKDEAIILCPANHSPPIEVLPHAGAPGYETVASCLASPEVRARTAGVIAMKPEVA